MLYITREPSLVGSDFR